MAENTPKGARDDHALIPVPVHPVSPVPLDDQAARDNRSRQLNSNNDAYWQSRGQQGRPGASNRKSAK